ncbi:MAG TPA: hypothetical protein VHD87_16355, partial [Acidimicrobiales bacterium]|nr:hypothetical protein [Acidimicrobiales bacterium]
MGAVRSAETVSERPAATPVARRQRALEAARPVDPSPFWAWLALLRNAAHAQKGDVTPLGQDRGMRSLWDKLADLANRTDRVVTRSGFDAVGVTEQRRRTLIAHHLLTVIHEGVFLVGGGTPTWWQRARAAHVAVGPTSWLSHATALRWWGKPARSVLEIELLDVLRDAGLPLPTRNHDVIDGDGNHREIDLCYVPQKGTASGRGWRCAATPS